MRTSTSMPTTVGTNNVFTNSIHPRIPGQVSVAVLELRQMSNAWTMGANTGAHEGMWLARAQRGRNQDISA